MDGSPVDEAKYKDLKGLQQHYKDVVLQEIEAEKKRHQKPSNDVAGRAAMM